jgi:hypothetical protein
MITKLQKVHEGLKHNYGSNKHNLAGQLANACQGVRICNNVLLRPASTFEGIASDLRNAVGIYQRSHPQSARPAYIANYADDNAYYTNRRYNCNNNGYKRGGYNSCDGPKGNFRGSYRGNYGKSSNKKCFICGKPGCWSIKHTRNKQKNSRKRFRTYVQQRGLDDDYTAFLADFEGLEIGEESDDDFAAKNAHLDAYFTGTPIAPEDPHDVQFVTATCGPIDGQATTAMLNNAATLHALTGEDPYR